jgi:hypothetical protein
VAAGIHVRSSRQMRHASWSCCWVLPWTALAVRILAVRREWSHRMSSSSFASEVVARVVEPQVRDSSGPDSRSVLRAAATVERRSSVDATVATLLVGFACEQIAHLLARPCITLV